MKRITVYFSGRVQGVGFRITTQQLAAGYEVRGTVENLPDGRVMLIAEGVEEELVAFIEGIRDSQLGGFIRDCQIEWGIAQKEMKGFKIIRS